MLFHNKLTCIFLLFIFISCNHPSKQANAIAGTLELDESSLLSSTLSLDGEWEFYWNHLYTYQDFIKGGFQALEFKYLPGNWNKTYQDRSIGFATYLLKIKSSKPLLLSCKINNIYGAYSLSINGQIIAKNGQVSSTHTSNITERNTLVSMLPLREGINYLILQTSNYELASGGFGSIVIGTEENIQKTYKNNILFELFGSSVLLILGLYHIGFSLRRKKEKHLQYYGIFCIFLALRIGLTGESIFFDYFKNILLEGIVKVEYLTLFLAAPYISLYIDSLFPNESNQTITKSLVFISFSISGLILAFPLKTLSLVIETMKVFSLFMIVYSFYTALLAIINKRKNSRTLGVTFFLLVLFILEEIVNNQSIAHTTSNLNIGFLLFSFSQAFLLSGQIAREMADIEKVQHNLEFLIQERTAELEKSNTKAIKAKEEIETINSITLKILDSSSLDQTLYHIFDYILDRYPFDALALYFVDNSKKIAYPFKVRGKNLSDENFNFLKTFSFNLRENKSLFASALNRNKLTYLPRILSYILKKISDLTFVNTLNSKSILYIPVRIENKAYSMFMGTTNQKQLQLSKDDLGSISRFVSQIAGVVQKVRLLEETNNAKMEAEKQKKETEELNSLIKSLNEDQNIHVIMKKLYSYIETKYNLTFYGLGILNASKDFIQFKNMKLPEFLSKKESEKIESMKIPVHEDSTGLHSIVFKKKKTMYINKIRERGSPEEVEILRMCKFQNYIIIPLVLQGEVIGVLDLSGYSEKTLTRDDIMRLSILGEQLSGIVHSSNLVKKIQKEKDKVESARIETEILNSLLKRINDTNDIYKIAMEIFAYTHVVYQFKNYALFLLSQDGNYISLIDSNISQFVKDDTKESLSMMKIPIRKGLGAHGYVLSKKKVTYIPNIRKKFALPEEQKISDELNIKSIFIIPLVLHNSVIGFLDFTNQDERIKISNTDKTKLSILGEQVAGAIFNSNLLKQVQEEKKKVESAMQALQSAQNQLIESGKMAALGQLVAGVAHELNTPIGAIKATAENMRVSLKETMQYLPSLIRDLNSDIMNLANEIVSNAVNTNSFISTKDERKIKREMRNYLEAEGIDIASDISDTLVDIKIFKLEDRYNSLWMHPKRSEILKMIYDLAGLQIKVKNIESAVDKTSKIVYALKNYSHRESSNEKKDSNIIDGIETVIVIYQNYIKKGIVIEKNYEEIPNIQCYKDELNQIWTNLIHNSIQAMNGEGTIKISVIKSNYYFENLNRAADCIEVGIEDNGPGIPPEILPKIFNPFFTTKKAGEGSGLGLHLCKEIIDKHEGTISVDTAPGKTEFKIRIPILG
jgi:signal transduction histidine kinase